MRQRCLCEQQVCELRDAQDRLQNLAEGLVTDLVIDHGVFVGEKTPAYWTGKALDLEVKSLSMSLQSIRSAVFPLAPWYCAAILTHKANIWQTGMAGELLDD